MTGSLPNLGGLRAFEAAGRHLNFRAAADELGVTQGAVAQQVRALEAQTGQRLFERKSRGLAFTPIGRAYHARISEAFSRIREASELLAPGVSQVTVSVTPTFAAKWLIPNLPDLGARHPDIELRVLATENVLGFHGDGIDLAIRQGKPAASAGLETRLLFPSIIVAVAAPSLVEGMDLPLAPERLAGLPRLHDGHDLWPKFLDGTGAAEAAGRGIRVNQTALAIDAALDGQGVALASRFLVRRDLEQGRLVRVSDRELTEESGFHLVARRGSQRTPAVDRVIAWLTERSR